MREMVERFKTWWKSIRWEDVGIMSIFIGIGVFLIIRACMRGGGVEPIIVLILLTSGFPLFVVSLSVEGKRQEKQKEQGLKLAEQRTQELAREQAAFKKLLKVDGLIASKPKDSGVPRSQTDADRGFDEMFWTVEMFIKDPKRYKLTGR